MGRLQTGVLLFRDVPYERHAKKFAPGPEGIPSDWVGKNIGYRHGLVLWLNRALSRTSADRKAAGRVGELIKGLNNGGAYKSFRELARCYRFEVDLFAAGAKWELSVICAAAPSGNGHKLKARFDDLWAQDGICNPELLAVEAVIHTAVEGYLGTIKQCDVNSCERWFLATYDARRRFCSDHDSDDARSGTERRKKQLADAQKRARENAKTEEEKYWKERHGDKSIKSGRRRAKD